MLCIRHGVTFSNVLCHVVQHYAQRHCRITKEVTSYISCRRNSQALTPSYDSVTTTGQYLMSWATPQTADCESLTPSQGATQQSKDCESLTPTQGATQQSVDCESLSRTQAATLQSMDGESLTPNQGATQKNVDCESLTPTQGATQQSVGSEISQVSATAAEDWDP